MRMIAWSRYVLCAAVTVATLAVASAQVAGAGPRHSCAVVATPDADKVDDLVAVSADAANDVWAVGVSSGNRGPFPLVERWDSSKFSVVYPTCGTACPFFGSAYGVAAVSPSNVWIAGATCCSATGTMVLHWDGTKLTMIPSPNVPSSSSDYLLSITANGSAIWAVGFYTVGSGPEQTLTESFDGAHWNIVPSPNVGTGNNLLVGVTALSPTNVWALGSYKDRAGDQRSMVLNWNGSTWKAKTFPLLLPRGESVLVSGISSSSASNVWVADINASRNPAALLQHFDGTDWERLVPLPRGGSSALFNGIGTSAPNLSWVVGTDSSTNKPLVEENDTGHGWSVVPQTNPPSAPLSGLQSVAPVPGTTTAWAVGFSADPSISQQFALAEICT
jgi:hypothetical protein